MRLLLTFLFALIAKLLVPSSSIDPLVHENEERIIQAFIQLPAGHHEAPVPDLIAFEIEEESESFHGKKQFKTSFVENDLLNSSNTSFHSIRLSSATLSYRKDVLFHQPLFILHERFLI